MKNYTLTLVQFIIICLLIGSVAGCEVNLPAATKPSIKPLPNLPPSTAPFVYQVPESQSDWLSYNGARIAGREVGKTSVMESTTLRLEVRKEYGAAIQIYDKVTNQPLINYKDLGRESGMSSYAGPRSFADDSPRWKGIGYNPLQAGDDGMNPAPVLFHGFVNGWIYTKAQCLSWPHQDARRLPFFYEQWTRVDDNKVHVKVRLTHQREDKTFYAPEAQEWPMMMINGARKIHFYNGNAPYTNDATTVTDGIEGRAGANYIVHQNTPFGLTEPWQGVEIGTNRLIGLYTPGYYLAGYNVANIIAFDTWEGGNTITYTANLPMAHLDSDNVWYKEYSYIVGTEQEIRNYVYAQERFSTPDFFFNKFNGRNGWIIADGGYDQKEPFSQDNWQVTFTGKADGGPVNGAFAKLMSPYGNWKANDFRQLYIRMAYTGSPGVGAQAPLRLTWLLNGQAPDGVNSEYPGQNKIRFPRGVRQDGQTIPFAVINDGQMHTYRFDFTGKPMWKDIIQQFEIAHGALPSYVAPGEVLTIQYFGTRDPGD